MSSGIPNRDTHVQRNSLQFPSHDPPRLALADAAQQARAARKRRSLQAGGHTNSDLLSLSLSHSQVNMPTPARAPTTTALGAATSAASGQGALTDSGRVASMTTSHMSTNGYALRRHLRSPRVSTGGVTPITPPVSVSSHALATAAAPPLSSSPSPYEEATSAQTLLHVLKLRQQQRAGQRQMAQPQSWYSTQADVPARDPPASVARSSCEAQSESTSTLTSVYRQMQPRAGPTASPSASAAATIRTTPPSIPFSHEPPSLSSQLAAKSASAAASQPFTGYTPFGASNAAVGGVRTHTVEDTEATSSGADEQTAAALANGAIGLEPVLAEKMPTARCIMFNLLTTWGDDHEIGLCGVEMFNERGERIRLEPSPACSSSSPPPPGSGAGADRGAEMTGADADAHTAVLVNEVEVDGATVSKRFTTGGGRCLLLAQYAGTPEEIMSSKDTDDIATDPRGQLSSLVNEQNNTHDEANMFVMPYTPGEHHLVCFVFTKPTTISMIRLINYCGRGRVHTAKGARIVEITADDVCVFRGEVAQHSGDLLASSDQQQHQQRHRHLTMDDLDAETDALISRWGVEDCENILFTEDPTVLERVMTQTRTAAFHALLNGNERAMTAQKNGDDVRSRHNRLGTAAMTMTNTTTATDGAPSTSAQPAAALVLTASKDMPRGDRSRYVGGEAPMAVSARLLPAGARATESATPPRLTEAHASPEPALPPPRAASSDGCLGRSAAGAVGAARVSAQAWGQSPDMARVGSSSLAGPATSMTTSATAGTLATTGVAPRRQRAIKPRQPSRFPRQCPKEIRSICLELLSTWGDTEHIGLSGLRFRDAVGDLITIPLEHWAVQYPDGQRLAPALANTQLRALFDENHETACLLPFQPAMQLILVFAEPIPRLGALEVANYSLGEHTFCGAKDVRVFLSSAQVQAPALSSRVALQRNASSATAAATMNARGAGEDDEADSWCPHTEIFERLWTVAADPQSVIFLKQHAVQEVTPVAGVSLRKAPANLAQSRFQTYDLSLVANDGLDAFDRLAGSQLSEGSVGDGGQSAPSPTARGYAAIGVGPGTGGDRLDMAATLATGGLRAGFSSTMASFATSLNASMNIRAAMSMKRARMMLKERPDWLLDYQPYITPLLPVGYVCRVRLHLCARSIAATTTTNTNTDTEASEGPVFGTAAENMKYYLKQWVVKPLRACSFVNENGDIIRAIKPGSRSAGSRATSSQFRVGGVPMQARLDRGDRDMNAIVDEEEEDEDNHSLPMVAECVVRSSSPNALLQPASAAGDTSDIGTSGTGSTAAPMQVELELLYVADSPFCVSMVTLNAPLVLDGCAAWVKRAQMFMDDTLLFDSGEAVLTLRKGGHGDVHAETSPEGLRGGKVSKYNVSRMESRGPVSEPMPQPRRQRARTASGTALPECTTSLRPYVLFTLDESILADVYAEDVGRQSTS